MYALGFRDEGLGFRVGPPQVIHERLSALPPPDIDRHQRPRILGFWGFRFRVVFGFKVEGLGFRA